MRRLPLIVAFNLLAAGALLLLLEGLSRWLLPVAEPAPLIRRDRADWVGTRAPDPLLFWKMRPLLRYGLVTTNSLGLRGPEIPARKPTAPGKPGELRLLSLGESTTFAEDLPLEESYSQLLEEMLESRRMGQETRPVRVINAGVNGYSLFQGVTYLRHRGLDLEPDAVLTYFGHNDFLAATYRARRDAADGGESAARTDRQLFAERRRLRVRIAQALLRHSNLARLFARRGGEGGEEGNTAAVTPARRVTRVPAADRRWLYEELRRICRARDMELVIVIPWYREFHEHIPLLRELRAEWEETAGGMDGIVFVDLPARLADLERAREDYFLDRVHPNAAGHRLIAEIIAAALEHAWGEKVPHQAMP